MLNPTTEGAYLSPPHQLLACQASPLAPSLASLAFLPSPLPTLAYQASRLASSLASLAGKVARWANLPVAPFPQPLPSPQAASVDRRKQTPFPPGRLLASQALPASLACLVRPASLVRQRYLAPLWLAVPPDNRAFPKCSANNPSVTALPHHKRSQARLTEPLPIAVLRLAAQSLSSSPPPNLRSRTIEGASPSPPKHFTQRHQQRLRSAQFRRQEDEDAHDFVIHDGKLHIAPFVIA